MKRPLGVTTPILTDLLNTSLNGSFGVRLRDDGTPVITTETNKEEICRLDGEIRNKTVLQAGMISGKLTHHKGVKDITSCIERCCVQEKCHVAMMMADKCYSVFCTNEQFCQPKPAPVETHHTNPTVAYVKRGEISFAPRPKLEPIMPLIERFHPNLEQAVEEEYVEDEDDDSNESGEGDESQRNSTESTPRKDTSEELEGSGRNLENDNDQSGSGESGDSGDGDVSGESGSGDSSGDGIEREQEQSSGESGDEESEEDGSGTEESGESGEEEDSGESGDEEEEDGSDGSDGDDGGYGYEYEDDDDDEEEQEF
ncbi:hypothetical protein OS493_034624 [Desmophyllum pertusum]|uniref:MANSC domain-containing protein n=1 Tax=Desmophyllum pertusum TaxID=174260 RepID=A0A9W9ZKN0_9CNID|nr:hypothetical protein OS493_034624 [Desmophyllum pertusum]